MSTDRDVTGIVRSWLEEGATSLPERVLDDVLAQLPTTPQRRAHWPAWRFHSMSSPLKIALVAAAIGALALVSLDVLPRSPDIVGAPAPSASPSPSPALLEGYGPSLAAGTYYGPIGTGTWTVTVPEGWEDFYSILWKDVDGISTPPTKGGPGEVAFGWWEVANVFADPCHWKDSLLDPPVGPTVDDLATAFLGQVGREGSATDVVFGGYPAKKIELSAPADLDVATCDEGVYREFLDPRDHISIVPDDTYPDTSGQSTVVLYILDIEGQRFMMRTWHRPEASAQDVAEMEAMLASIVIDPPAPSAAASLSPLAWSPGSPGQDWPAPVRAEPIGDPVVVSLDLEYTDPSGDIASTDVPWIDIERVYPLQPGASTIRVDYAAAPPTKLAGSTEPAIVYGLVFDLDLDGVADVRLGLHHRDVWRTDLRTGRTSAGRMDTPWGIDDRPYCECEYPHERQDHARATIGYRNDVGGILNPPRFYAWASMIEDGRVVATDYAPDAGWLDMDS